MQPDFPDHTSRTGAEAHAARLTAWWAERGHPEVRWTAVQMLGMHAKAGGEAWTVRSNLVMGWPWSVTAAPQQ